MTSQVDIVTTTEDFGELRGEWNALARQVPGSQFFQTHDWLSVYWNHFGQNQELRIATTRDNGKLTAVVPLVLRREVRQVGEVRVLTYPLDDWGSLFQPLTLDVNATTERVLAYLAEAPRDWNILSWRWCQDHQPSTRALRRQMSELGMRVHESVRETAAFIELPSTFDEYMDSRSSKFRNNVKRWRRRVEEYGTLRFEKYRATEENGWAPRWELWDFCVELAARSWQGSSQTGTTLSHPEIKTFLRDVHGVAANLGAIDVNLMYLNDEPVAFEYGYCWHGYKYALRFGYDASCCNAGIGNVMWLESIKASIEAGDHTFDMGPGSLEYKRHYCTHMHDCLTLDHFSKSSTRAQLIALKHDFSSWWSSASPFTTAH